MAEAATGSQRARRSGAWGIALAALLLAGCNTIVPRGPNERPAAPPPPPPAQTTRPVGVDAGVLQDNQRDRVALLVPLSGPNAGIGQSLANATQLAVLDAKTEKLRITTYDTAAGGAAAATNRALADGAQLILGPLLKEDIPVVLPAARAAHVPVVSFSNDVSQAQAGLYLLGYVPAQSVARVVDYAHAQGANAFGGLMPTGLYGQRSATAYLRAVEGEGGKVIALQTFDRGAAGAVAGAARLAKSGPFDAVLIADTLATAAAAAPTIRRSGNAVHLLGTELWGDSSRPAPPALAGAWFASVPEAFYRRFAARYRARFSRDPYRLASLGYDAVLLTVRIARDWQVGTPFPEARLRDRGGFSGIDGAFRFGRDGIAERALQVQELKAGAVPTVVSPAPTGFDER